jgi:hypothetical protein
MTDEQVGQLIRDVQEIKTALIGLNGQGGIIQTLDHHAHNIDELFGARNQMRDELTALKAEHNDRKDAGVQCAPLLASKRVVVGAGAIGGGLGAGLAALVDIIWKRLTG